MIVLETAQFFKNNFCRLCRNELSCILFDIKLMFFRLFIGGRMSCVISEN